MKMVIGEYDFEMDENGDIHICETRNNRRRYYDMVRTNAQLLEDEFRKKCKEWYFRNVIIL